MWFSTFEVRSLLISPRATSSIEDFPHSLQAFSLFHRSEKPIKFISRQILTIWTKGWDWIRVAESGSAMKIRNPPGNLGLLVHISFPGQASKGQVSLTVGSRPRSAYVLPNYIPFLRSRASAASAQTSLFILFHHLKSFSELNLTPSSRLIKLVISFIRIQGRGNYWIEKKERRGGMEN